METSIRLSLFRGLLLILAAGLLFTASFGQEATKNTADTTTQTILFVCEHGAAKSVIAAAYFDKLAREQGLNYKAVFRGTNPDPTVSPVTKKGLKEDGIDVADWKPEVVSRSDMEKASQIITLGCSLPDEDKVVSKLTDWNEIPSPSNYELARDAISKRVQNLVDDLVKKEKESKERKRP